MPSKQKGPHHRGDYHVRSAQVRAAAYANPATPCWRCGRTLEQHPPTKTGNPPRWSAGHLRDGDPQSPLLPEVLSCNARAGAPIGNRSPLRRKSAAWRPQPPKVTDLTW